MESHLFELRLWLALAALVSFWLIGAIGMWLRRAGEPSITRGFFVAVWIVLTGLVSFFEFPLYGAAAIPPAAISAAISLAVIYGATRIGDSTPRGWRGIALAGGVAALATVIFPFCLLIATAFLGIDGP